MGVTDRCASHAVHWPTPPFICASSGDLRDVLPHIEVPTLLLYGDADERSPLSVARELHARIPRSTLAVMPGLGHECYLESAEAFEAEVRDFLATPPPHNGSPRSP